MSTATPSKGAAMLAELRKGLKGYRECGFPGAPAMRIIMVPLSDDELQESLAAAGKRFRKLEIDITVLTADDFNIELHIQSLARAMRDPEDPERKRLLFGSADELRAAVTADERILLVDEYLEAQAACNPQPDSIPDELFKQIEGAIKKKDRALLSSIGSRTLVDYLISTECLLSS